MKKSLLGLLLAVLLVAPAFAFCGEDVEIVPKAGFIIKPEMTEKINGTRSSSLRDSGYTAGGDIYIAASDKVFVGAGAMWGNNINVYSNKAENAYCGHKIGFTNLYFTAKYKFEVAEEDDATIIMYPLLQFGMGIPGWSKGGNYPLNNYEIEPGLYWGLGIGGEYKNIIAEFIYTCDYGKEKGIDMSNHEVVRTFSYTAFRFQVGYKFSI